MFYLSFGKWIHPQNQNIRHNVTYWKKSFKQTIKI